MPDPRTPDPRTPDPRTPDPRTPDPSLDAIRRSDDFIDALAAARPVTPRDQVDATLASLLAGWRDETRWPPATGLISEPQAVAALNAGLSERRTSKRNPGTGPENRPTTKRNRRGLTAVGVSAAAVLCIGGFGALVAEAGPGDALYGLRTMLFGATKQVREDQVGLAARTELNQVQELISKGDWEHAQEKLVAVSAQVESIDDAGQKQQLVEQFNDLSAKVVERDPNATAPPGITYTVPPSSTELVPTVAPTSVPSVPPTTEATTSAESTASESVSTTPSEPTSSAESPTTEASPGSETPTTSPTSVTPTTTPTSATPATTTPPTTVPPTTVPPTTVPPTTTTPAPGLTLSTIPPSASELPQLSGSVITTTVVVPQPVPVGG